MGSPVKTRHSARSIYFLPFFFLCIVSLISLGFAPANAQGGSGVVVIVEISGVINPPVANYLFRTLGEAQDQDARLVVILLDTPGGLESSMREMIQAILGSPVPVVVYVAPSGSRAASAGLFLLVSAHVAAMAPGTNTGAAHPVGLGGGEVDDVSAAKAVNDAAATIRALAIERGRNPDWTEQAVRESVSATAAEALELSVIDIVARDLDDLLRQIDGMTVETVAGPVTLDVSGATRSDEPMNFAENFLHAISDPNIAFILLSVGSIGILAELYNPGSLIPGITGAISLILAFFSLGNLPTNWAGVALVGLAVVLFVAELSTEGTGVLGIGAVIAFLLGGLILFRPLQPVSPALPTLSVNPIVVGISTATMGGLVLLVMTQVIRSRHAPLQTGPEHFTGRIAVVQQELNPAGRVWFEGQAWNAYLSSGGLVPNGQRVRIVGLEGLTLIVEPVEDGQESPSVG